MEILEHESTESEIGLTSDRDKVTAFLDLVSTFPECSAAILSSKFLRNKKAFGLSGRTSFTVHKISASNRNELLKACTSHGHISVLFAHERIDEICDRFLQLGYYGLPSRVNFGTNDATDPMSAEDSQSLKAFLQSPLGNSSKELLAFSHDAAQFFRIYP